MPTAALCPSCGGPLSETSVVALAPVCEHCKVVILGTGGTLGLTSAYGVNDPSITRRRVEADLAVFSEYRNKYVGMLEACKEQLTWGVAQYATFPPAPAMLALIPVPPLVSGCAAGVFLYCCVSVLIMAVVGAVGFADGTISLMKSVPMFFALALMLVIPLLIASSPHFRAKAANGKRPLENARRQRDYSTSCAAALKAAEPIKAAQDHRLRCQIRELEGLIKTVTAKAEDVRCILKTL